MVKIPTTDVAHVARRLAQAADLQGNRDGVASPSEIKGLRVPDNLQDWTLDGENDAGRAAYQALQGTAEATTVRTLAPALVALPPALRGLALELDAVWGDSDGHLSAAEIDKVARFTLAALPFFVPDAEAIIELAGALGYGGEGDGAPLANVLNLRLALAQVPAGTAEKNAPFRALLDEAIQQSDAVGMPELLRNAARHNPRYHSLSVLEHTAYAVKAIDALNTAAGTSFDAGPAIMLLHDVGKIIDRQLWTHDDGSLLGYSFKGHEAAGAAWLEARGFDADMLLHVRFHGDYRTMDADEIRGLCTDEQTLGEAMLVLLADSLAKGNQPATVESIDAELPKIATLLEEAGLDSELVIDAFKEFRASWFTAEAIHDA